MTRLLALLGVVLLGLAACEMPQPFRHSQPNPLLTIGSRAGVVVEPMTGLPDWFPEALAEALRDYDVAAAVALGNPGSYRVATSLSRDGDTAGILWTVYDPEGAEIGRHQAELAAAAIADPESLQRLAGQAAAPLAAVLAGPNVPQRRKPVIALRPVQGATFDGNQVVTDAMRQALIEAGYPLSDNAREAELVIHGSVQISPARTGFEHVEVVWSVLRPGQAQPVGSMRQANDVPFGTLQLTWKPIAPAIAGAAVSGLNQLVRRTQKGG